MFRFLSIALAASFLCAPAGIIPQKSETDPIAYQDSAIMPLSVDSTHITYTSKSITASHALAYQCPMYTHSPAIGACGSVAAGNLIGFYDRYDENLIPNHVAGKTITGLYCYSIQDDAVVSAITTLYEYMKSDDHIGSTEDEFIDAVKRYCKEKGKNTTFSSCMKSKKFDYSTAKNYLDNNQPIVLFLAGYNVAEILTESDNSDMIGYFYSSANHIMICFGYRTYTYTTAQGVVDYDLLKISSGLAEYNTGYFDINFKTTINDALAVNIY